MATAAIACAPDLRELVTFAELNLAQDAFPSLTNDTNAMDLILCRNLLIYFTPAHARRLIGNLRQSLVDDGWLIVSPSECSQALFSGFVPVNFPGSILYRKGEAHRSRVASPHRRPRCSEPRLSRPLPDAGSPGGGPVAGRTAFTDSARPIALSDELAAAEALYAQGRLRRGRRRHCAARWRPRL